MSEQSTDELRLRATEAQMRRALGLDNTAPATVQNAHPIPSNGSPTRRRQFVRDGEVPVTVVHHDDHGTTNKLEAARQALREQSAARERAEQHLAKAQATIQALETQLAHERIAREEALSRAEMQRQELERQLEEERASRKQAEQEQDKAITDRQEAEERLRAMIAAQAARIPPNGTLLTEKPASAKASDRASDRHAADPDAMPVEESATVRKRRGRPPKERGAGSGFVEWWKPGWRGRFR
jgi:DNA repair exonuclease SbcCD ATPase subunit